MDKTEKRTKMCKKYCECMSCTHFTASSSKYGLKEGEFDEIPHKMRKKLIRLIARIMEKAYRRGVQQAITLYKNNLSPGAGETSD